MGTAWRDFGEELRDVAVLIRSHDFAGADSLDRDQTSADRGAMEKTGGEQHRTLKRVARRAAPKCRRLRNRAQRSGDDFIERDGRASRRLIPCYSLFRRLGNSLSTGWFFIKKQ